MKFTVLVQKVAFMETRFYLLLAVLSCLVLGSVGSFAGVDPGFVRHQQVPGSGGSHDTTSAPGGTITGMELSDARSFQGLGLLATLGPQLTVGSSLPNYSAPKTEISNEHGFTASLDLGQASQLYRDGVSVHLRVPGSGGTMDVTSTGSGSGTGQKRAEEFTEVLDLTRFEELFDQGLFEAESMMDRNGGTLWYGNIAEDLQAPVQITADKNSDGFAAYFNDEGKMLWHISFGGTGSDVLQKVALMEDGNLLVSGQFSNIARFGGHELQSRGETDVFVALISPKGKVAWVQQIGANGNDSVKDLAFDSEGIHVSGQFSFKMVFGNSADVAHGELRAFQAGFDLSGEMVYAEMD